MQQSSRRARVARTVRQVVSVLVALALLVGGAYVLLDAYSTRADAAARAYGGVQEPELAAEVPQALPVVSPRREVAGTTLQPEAPARRTRAQQVGVGSPVLTMQVPRLWGSRTYTVIEGVRLVDLARGPGRYPFSAMPGEQGNLAIAAHRWDGPFLDFERLRVGDDVVVAQGEARWTYTITRAPTVIEATDVHVVDPTPGRRLTLTTCWPKNGSSKRMYVRARLTRSAA